MPKTKRKQQRAAIQPPKPYLALPITKAVLDDYSMHSQAGRIGCALPLRFGAPEVTVAESSKDLAKAAKANSYALAELVRKLVGPTVRHASLYQSAFSQNRIIYVTTSQLFPDNWLERLSDTGLQKLLRLCVHNINAAIMAAYKFGYRVVLLHDQAHTDKLLDFLATLRYVMPPHISFAITLQYSQVSLIMPVQYHLRINPKVFQVVNDISMEQTAASEYLSYCLRYKLTYMQLLNAVHQPISWLKRERVRIRRANLPLIIMDVGELSYTRSSLDALMAKKASVCRYADLLLRGTNV